MRRTAQASIIAASLLLSGCASAATQTASVQPLDPAASEPVVAAPVVSAPIASLDSPDPASIVELPQAVAGAAPVSVAVPGLGPIPVVGVGMDTDGQAEVPADVSTVGWYSYGSAPGDGDGTVVLMGHRDGKGSRGALYNLPSVPVGAEITVTDATGAAFTYVVQTNESIDKQVVPLADLFVREGPARLVVISCGGPYVKAQGGYLENVVLTAVPR